MLRVDLHLHTAFSPDSLMSPARLVERCLAVGLTCIAVTDHNTIQGAREVQRIAPFQVIVGEEIKTSEGEVIGLFLGEAIPRGLSPQETAQRIHQQGGLVSIPHPFDQFRRSVITPQGLEALRPYADLVEGFNARNTLQSANRRAQELAHQWDTPAIAVTDSHLPVEVGRTYMEIPEYDGTPQGFQEALAQARLVTRPMTPLIHVLTTLTKGWKRVGRTLPSPRG